MPHDIPPIMPPIIEKTELSDEAKLSLSLADVFYDAACTDCYVTRSLVTALRTGIAALPEDDFRNMVLEIDDELVVDEFHQARETAREECST